MSELGPLGVTFDPDAIPAAPPVLGREFALWYAQRALPEFVWDAAVLEGSPFTYPEVKTLAEGITVGGHKVSDAAVVQGIINASRLLGAAVREGRFALTPGMFDELHALVGRGLALDAGPSRDGGDGGDLAAPHEQIVDAVMGASDDPWHQALLYAVAGYFNGGGLTSRLMMNGHLMSHGIEPISIPASARREYRVVMSQAYATGDASDALAFIGNSHERHARARKGLPDPPTPRKKG